MKSLVKILAVALLTLIVYGTQAQHGGFKIGLNMSNATIKDDGKKVDQDQSLLYSPRVGFYYDGPIYENVFMQTGLYGSISGFTSKYKETEEEETFDVTEKMIMIYIEIPVSFGYKYPINEKTSVFGMFGPVFRFLPYSTLAYKINDSDWDNDPTHEEEGSDKVEWFKKFDLALNIEVGVQYDRFQFSFFYNPSMLDVLNDDFMGAESTWKNYCFGFNVGILFGKM